MRPMEVFHFPDKNPDLRFLMVTWKGRLEEQWKPFWNTLDSLYEPNSSYLGPIHAEGVNQVLCANMDYSLDEATISYIIKKPIEKTTAKDDNGNSFKFSYVTFSEEEYVMFCLKWR